MSRIQSMGKRAKRIDDAEPPAPAIPPDLKLLLDLIEEQRSAGTAKAKSSSDRMNALWIAKGQHMVLLVSRAHGAQGPNQTLYVCNLLEVRNTP